MFHHSSSSEMILSLLCRRSGRYELAQSCRFHSTQFNKMEAISSRSSSLAESLHSDHGMSNSVLPTAGQHAERGPSGTIGLRLSAVLDLGRGSDSMDDQTSVPLITASDSCYAPPDTLVEEVKSIKSLDLRLLPPVWLMGMMHGFNKNVSHAKTMGMSAHLQISDDQWSLLLMTYFIGFILTSAAILFYLQNSRVNTLRHLCTYTFCSGLVTGLNVLAPRLSALGIEPWTVFAFTRFAQGVLEGAYSPHVITYLLQFYSRKQLSDRMWLFFLVPALSSALGAVYAYAMIHISHGKLLNWQWLYLVESLFTVILSLCCHLVLPSRPRRLVSVCEAESKALSPSQITSQRAAEYRNMSDLRELWYLIRQPAAYTWMLLDIALGIPATTLLLYLPQLILRLQFSQARANLLTAFPHLFAAVALVCVIQNTNRPDPKHMIIVIFLFQIIGFGIYRLTFLRTNLALQNLAYASTFLMALGIGTTNVLAAKHYGMAIQSDRHRLMLNALGTVLINFTGIITSWTFRAQSFSSDNMTIVFVVLGFVVSIIDKSINHQQQPTGKGLVTKQDNFEE